MLFQKLCTSRFGSLGVLLIAIACLTSGCGSSGEHPTAKVSGLVTIDGQPLKFGSVLFVPEGNLPSAEANIRSDGTYDLGTYTSNDGAVIAKHKVMITARLASGSALPEDSVKGAAGTVSAIPEKYGDLEKSGLVAEVTADTNEIDFALVTAAPKPTE